MSELSQLISFESGKLNWDDSLEFMPKGDSRYRLNVVFSDKYSGGVLTNMKGNKSRVLIAMPSGTNTVIGGCEDKENLAYVYFVYNDEGKHSILRYYSTPESISPILWQENILNFSLSKPIVNPVIVGNILKWLNGKPQQINMSKATLYTQTKYNEGIGYWIIEDTFFVS
jgi:hypothetical protein